VPPSSHIRLEKIRPRQILIRAEDPYEVFAGNIHELRKACPRADENGLVTVFVQEREQRPRAPHQKVEFEVDAHRLEQLCFRLHEDLWKPEFRNAVDHDAA